MPINEPELLAFMNTNYPIVNEFDERLKPQQKKNFWDLLTAAHRAGFDIWIEDDKQINIGRKNNTNENDHHLFGMIYRKKFDSIKIWTIHTYLPTAPRKKGHHTTAELYLDDPHVTTLLENILKITRNADGKIESGWPTGDSIGRDEWKINHRGRLLQAAKPMDSQQQNIDSLFRNENFQCSTQLINWLGQGESNRELFTSLARFLHGCGVDWWFTNDFDGERGPIRFGVNSGAEKSVFGGVDPFRPGQFFRITDCYDEVFFRQIGQFHRQPLSQELIDAIRGQENIFVEKVNDKRTRNKDSNTRSGMWPKDFESNSVYQGNSGAQMTSKNRILYGPPGTGKTFNTISHALAILEGSSLEKIDDERKVSNKDVMKRFSTYLEEKKQLRFVTFHQSYGYEEFVEGLRPRTTDDHQVGYHIEPGVFKLLCEEASKNSDEPHVIIIDEINRGNISKIFGELITLIEPDKRAGEKHHLTVTLPYSQEQFSVPNNVFIIGTMNTADRSLATVDIALRRRFAFKEMMPKPELLDEMKEIDGINLGALLRAMNNRIEVLVDREHTLGHAFLMKVQTFADLREAFEYTIIPLLQEYFFDDWNKIRLVLGNNDFVTATEVSYGEVFGHNADGWEEGRKICALNPVKLNEAQQYLNIIRPELRQTN